MSTVVMLVLLGNCHGSLENNVILSDMICSYFLLALKLIEPVQCSYVDNRA